jgi:hypothetical protein
MNWEIGEIGVGKVSGVAGWNARIGWEWRQVDELVKETGKAWLRLVQEEWR